MKARFLFVCSLLALAVVVARGQADKESPKSRQWTLDEAMGQLRLNPRDSYLQYVALQLARREGRVEQTATEIERLTASAPWQARRGGVDLFSIFTGALAVQESLQLDAMTGRQRREPALKREEKPGRPENEDERPAKAAEGKHDAVEKPNKETVRVADLSGPTVKSHPWDKMLAGKKPAISPLARSVPDDYYFIEFHSLSKLLEAMEISDLWGTHLFDQAVHEARSQKAGDRLKKQLVVETSAVLRPFYDLVVREVAVTGSDLFAREGSDVTLLFRFKQPDVFKSRMDGFLANAEKALPGVRRTTGKYLDVAYVHLETPDRDVNVYSAYAEPDLHVRSNSEAALRRVLAAIHGKTAAGKAVRRLGDTSEFAYIRTLLPRGAKQEDGFVYLSDPFIRHMVGARLKLTERRRMVCYNNLRMIGHASLLYRTEHGCKPDLIEALAKEKCSPGRFNEGELRCPDGGTYTLSKDGNAGVCSHHGHAHFLTPCCEIPVSKVTDEEAEEYHAFVKDYNQYWRTYFDPIALRLQITPNRYRLETVVLPLIDNSIYTSLARVLGGKPQNLDALPVPKRNIFTFAIRVNKEELRHEVGLAEAPAEDGQKPAAGRHVVTAADRHCAQDLQQIGLALHNYHDAYEQFPAAASHDRGGNPLLSWRVHLLPFLEQQALYDEFHLDEPWDSEHNKKLIARMPAVYRCGGPQLAARGKTTCVAPVGKRTIFPPDGRKVTFASITDGSSETIAVVTVDRDHAVTWTRPDDLEFDPEKPSAGLFNKRRPIAPVVFVDASVHFLRDTIDEKTLQALFTRDAGDHFVVKDTDGIDDTAGVDLLHIPGVDPAEIERLKVEEFLARGVGDQVTLNIYDAPPMFDFNVPGFLGLMAGSFNGSTRAVGTEELLVSFVVASLNAPVYIGIPVQDGKVVDRFLDRLDHPLAVAARQHEGGFLPVDFDFYKFPSKQDKNKVFRSYGLRLGPAKLRLFWARIGGGLYIASKPFILEDLLAAEADRATAPAHDKSKDTGPRAHAMVRIRPQHWDKVLPDFRLGWAENNREACLNNIGPLSSVARAYTGTAGKINEVDVGQVSARILQYADFLHTVHFFCPDGGSYVLAPDRKSMVCSVHGSILAPRQADAPADKSALGRLLDTFTGMTASLTFLADGLHAVVTIDRK